MWWYLCALPDSRNGRKTAPISRSSRIACRGCCLICKRKSLRGGFSTSAATPSGNMWPMLAGIGAVLGEGDLGTYVSPDGDHTTWFYKAGKAGERSPKGRRGNCSRD